jgi:hypothetical protein
MPVGLAIVMTVLLAATAVLRQLDARSGFLTRRSSGGCRPTRSREQTDCSRRERRRQKCTHRFLRCCRNLPRTKPTNSQKVKGATGAESAKTRAVSAKRQLFIPTGGSGPTFWRTDRDVGVGAIANRAIHGISVRPTRKPKLKYRLPEVIKRRLPERAAAGTPFQVPPRATRLSQFFPVAQADPFCGAPL